MVIETDTYREYIKGLNTRIQQAPADVAQTYQITIEDITLNFDQLIHHSEIQKKHVVVVFEEIVFKFEEWITEVVQKLENGEIVTVDIEEFERELTVRYITLNIFFL